MPFDNLAADTPSPVGASKPEPAFTKWALRSSMSLQTRPGDLITYLAKGGTKRQREVANAALTEGERYVVENVEVGGFVSKVRIAGHETSFNTVMFQNYFTPVEIAPARSDLKAEARP